MRDSEFDNHSEKEACKQKSGIVYLVDFVLPSPEGQRHRMLTHYVVILNGFRQRDKITEGHYVPKKQPYNTDIEDDTS